MIKISKYVVACFIALFTSITTFSNTNNLKVSLFLGLVILMIFCNIVFIFQKVKQFSVYVFEFIYKDNKAKLYTLVVYPIIAIESSLILFLTGGQIDFFYFCFNAVEVSIWLIIILHSNISYSNLSDMIIGQFMIDSSKKIVFFISIIYLAACGMALESRKTVFFYWAIVGCWLSYKNFGSQENYQSLCLCLFLSLFCGLLGIITKSMLKMIGDFNNDWKFS